MPPTQPTIADSLARCQNALEAVGVDSARRDAEVLLAQLLGVDRVALYAHGERRLDVDRTRQLDAWIARRAQREPVAYITGAREFWSLPLEVNRDVLIPRPETELLVEACLERARRSKLERIVDIGTGSGAIVAALASELPEARFVATDISPSALRVARRNLQKLALIDRVDLRLGDLYEPIASETGFDAIVSNPPYVSDGEARQLMADVRNWEPMTALLGGDDGLCVIRRLIAGAPSCLRPGGYLLVEIGANQAPAVRELLDGAGFDEIEVDVDLAGLDRVAVGRRRD